MKTPQMYVRRWGLLPLLALAIPGLPAMAEDLPPGVERIIPRGQIAAIVEPSFVSATEAEISDDAWILGVEIAGETRAYSLNLLNRHEVVNDKVGDNLFAAVW
jgi:hypothetical protein